MLLGKELIIIPSQSSRRLGVLLVFYTQSHQGLEFITMDCDCSALDDLEMGEPRNILEPRTPSSPLDSALGYLQSSWMAPSLERSSHGTVWRNGVGGVAAA